MQSEQAFEKYHAIITQGQYNPEAIRAFKAFRKSLFVDQLGWDLSCTGNLEVDQYDQDHTVYCILYYGKTIVGGWRAVRTDFPYLCQQQFSQLAKLRPYPKRADVWEISRFGYSRMTADADHCSRVLYSLMFRFSMSRWCSALVAVADLFHERLLRRIGIRTKRYGQPIQIKGTGKDHIMRIVAGEIPMGSQNKSKLVELLKYSEKLEIIDETLVFRSESIPA